MVQGTFQGSGGAGGGGRLVSDSGRKGKELPVVEVESTPLYYTRSVGTYNRSPAALTPQNHYSF